MTTPKERFPFKPFQDSFLLEILTMYYSKQYPEEQNLVSHFESKWQNKQFTFSPNQWKQIHMVTFANNIRDWIHTGSDQKILDLLENLVSGKEPATAEGSLDVALELVEWIFTGFEKDNVVLEFLQFFLGKLPGFEGDFLNGLRKAYESEVNEPKP